MSDFKILSDRDHILMRPQMYIGSVSEETVSMMCDFQYQDIKIVPGLLKVINEIIDNSVDEAIRTKFQHANRIDVDMDFEPLTQEWCITVTDNGRGIPVVKHGEIYQAQAAWTQAKAGTSFTDDRTTIGANGVGSFCTNVFSTTFIGESCDGKQKVKVHCKDSCNPEETKVTVTKSSKSGTKIQFWPNLQLFNIDYITDEHLKVIRDRLINLAICYPKIKFSFNKEKINPGSLAKVAKEFNDDAQSFTFGDNINIIVGPSGDDSEFRYLSYINGLNLKNGGSHIDFMVGQIASSMQPQIKRKWKIDVLPNQIKQHLLFCVWADGFTNPKFDSQSKERLTNTVTEVREFFKEVDYEKIAKRIIATDAIINPMVEAILYKKQMAEKRAAKAALKKAAKRKIAKHLVATSNNPQDTILHIAEGLSASSTLLTIRDSKIHGCYSLKGKIMNTHGMKPKDVTKNTELLDLMSIIGLSLDDPSINEDPSALYEVEYQGETFIVGINDIIITKDGQQIKAKELMK